MDKKGKILIATLRCPHVNRVSQVVENALEDVLSSVLRFGEDITEGLHLGYFRRALEDQFFEQDGFVSFDGNEQEVMNYQRDPYGCFQSYLTELNTMLALIAAENKSVIDLVQCAHWDAQLELSQKLPNHWIISVVKGG